MNLKQTNSLSEKEWKENEDYPSFLALAQIKWAQIKI